MSSTTADIKPKLSIENDELQTVMKRYEYAGAERVAAQIAKMLNDANRDKRKSYFVRKDLHGCSLIEAEDLKPMLEDSTKKESSDPSDKQT